MSPKDKALQIRMSEVELLWLQNTAKEAGFENVSAFVRSMVGKKQIDMSMARQTGMLMEILDKVRCIYEHLEKQSENKTKQKKK